MGETSLAKLGSILPSIEGLDPGIRKLGEDVFNNQAKSASQNFFENIMPRATEQLARTGKQFGGVGDTAYTNLIKGFNEQQSQVASQIGMSMMEKAFAANENAKSRQFSAELQKQSQDYSSSEAQKGRDFTSSESQKGRDFTSGLEQNRTLLDLANSGQIELTPDQKAKLGLGSGFKNQSQVDIENSMLAKGLDPNNPTDVTNFTTGLRTADKTNARSGIIAQLIAQNKEPTAELVDKYMCYIYPEAVDPSTGLSNSEKNDYLNLRDRLKVIEDDKAEVERRRNMA
jgi:hypothetical protein